MNKRCQTESMGRKNSWSRRSFLKWAFVITATTQFPLEALGSLYTSEAPSKRSLSLHNIHTGESFKGIYWSNGTYLTESLNQINGVFRDFRTNEVISIDPHLLDILSSIQLDFTGNIPLQIISGYRSPTTNEHLRRTGHRVARCSLHTRGKAADISLPDISLIRKLKTAAIKRKAGGVGYYPKRNFVHVDTGRVRYW